MIELGFSLVTLVLAGAWVVEHNYLQYCFPTWPAALDHANRLAEEEA